MGDVGVENDSPDKTAGDPGAVFSDESSRQPTSDLFSPPSGFSRGRESLGWRERKDPTSGTRLLLSYLLLPNKEK